MDKNTLVYIDLNGASYLVGQLWARARKNKESATFEYDPGWLQHAARFSLEPALALGPGPFHTPADAPMFGAIGDSAPDRWGRALMRRMDRRRAGARGRGAAHAPGNRLPAAGGRRGPSGRAALCGKRRRTLPAG